MTWIGLDIGGTKIAALAVTAHGRRAEATRPTDAGNLIGSATAAVDEVLAAIGTDRAAVAGIGIGAPGLVDRAAGTIELALNLGVSAPLAVAAPLSNLFGAPVAVENDVRLAARGVQAHLSLRDLAYLSLGTGISAGIILNGRLWRGRNNMAGEVGHLTVDDDGAILEAGLAGPAIVALARARGVPVQRASDVFHRAAADDRAAQAVVDTVCRRLARLVQWLILTYDVDTVVLGGGVTRAGDALLAPLRVAMARLRDQADLNRRLLTDDKVRLLPGDLNAGLLGGVQLARELAAEAN